MLGTGRTPLQRTALSDRRATVTGCSRRRRAGPEPDLTKHLACAHLTTLDLLASRGETAPPQRQLDEALELIFRLGLEHERAYLERLKLGGCRVVEMREGGDLGLRVRLTDEALVPR